MPGHTYMFAVAAARSQAASTAAANIAGAAGAASGVIGFAGGFAAQGRSPQDQATITSLAGLLGGVLTLAAGMGPIGIIFAVIGGALAFAQASSAKKSLHKQAKAVMKQRNVELLWAGAKNLIDQQDVSRDTTLKQAQIALLSAEGTAADEAASSALAVPFGASESIAQATEEFFEAQALAKLIDVEQGRGPNVTIATISGVVSGLQTGIGLTQAIEEFKHRKEKGVFADQLSTQLEGSLALQTSADAANASATFNNLTNRGRIDRKIAAGTLAVQRSQLQVLQSQQEIARVRLQRLNRERSSDFRPTFTPSFRRRYGTRFGPIITR